MWFTMPILLCTAVRPPLPFVISTVAFMAPAFSAIPIRTVSSFGMPHLRKSKRPFGREMSPNRRRFSPAAATNTDKMASAPSPYNLLRWIQRHLRQTSAHASRSLVPAHRACRGARGTVTSGTPGLDHPHCGCAALEAPLGRGSFCS